MYTEKRNNRGTLTIQMAFSVLHYEPLTDLWSFWIRDEIGIAVVNLPTKGL